MRKIRVITIWVIALTFYLNFGWHLIEYYEGHILCDYARDGGIFEKILNDPLISDKINAGGSNICAEESERIANNRAAHFVMSAVWPILIGFCAIGWLLYGIYYSLWLIFAGGIVKLLGAENFFWIIFFSIILFGIIYCIKKLREIDRKHPWPT
ncbi:MAG: hypothetical protein Q8L47_00110 [bacterium]|nr:hypothetical protein [bacterium]